MIASVEIFYSPEWKHWAVQSKDAEDNQIGECIWELILNDAIVCARSTAHRASVTQQSKVVVKCFTKSEKLKWSGTYDCNGEIVWNKDK